MTCADCNGGLYTKDDALVALGRRWHDGCFKCAGCRAPLGSTETFAEHDGAAFHLGCVPTPEAEPCRACGQPVRGEYVRAADDKYHARCLLAHCTHYISAYYERTTRGASCARVVLTMAMATLAMAGCTCYGYRILTRCFTCAGCKGSLDGGYLPRQCDGRPCCSAECAAKSSLCGSVGLMGGAGRDAR